MVARATSVDAVTNGAADVIESNRRYTVEVEIEGVRPILFHRWDCDAIDAKAGAKKGSKAKKTDNLESYVYRNDDGLICLPATYLHAALSDTAKSFQDPRSPRKSARDLVRAGLMVLPDLAVVGPQPSKVWGFEHRGRVVVQRNAVTRTWPAFKEGWTAKFGVTVLVPQYLQPKLLQEILTDCGTLNGIADCRPTYGRFQVKSFKVIDQNPFGN